MCCNFACAVPRVRPTRAGRRGHRRGHGHGEAGPRSGPPAAWILVFVFTRHHRPILYKQRKLGKPQILCFGAILITLSEGARSGFEGSKCKYVDQKALDGWESHHGFPICVDCNSWLGTPSVPLQPAGEVYVLRDGAACTHSADFAERAGAPEAPGTRVAAFQGRCSEDLVRCNLEA